MKMFKKGALAFFFALITKLTLGLSFSEHCELQVQEITDFQSLEDLSHELGQRNQDYFEDKVALQYWFSQKPVSSIYSDSICIIQDYDITLISIQPHQDVQNLKNTLTISRPNDETVLIFKIQHIESQESVLFDYSYTLSKMRSQQQSNKRNLQVVTATINSQTDTVGTQAFYLARHYSQEADLETITWPFSISGDTVSGTPTYKAWYKVDSGSWITMTAASFYEDIYLTWNQVSDSFQFTFYNMDLGSSPPKYTIKAQVEYSTTGGTSGTVYHEQEFTILDCNVATVDTVAQMTNSANDFVSLDMSMPFLSYNMPAGGVTQSNYQDNANYNTYTQTVQISNSVHRFLQAQGTYQGTNYWEFCGTYTFKLTTFMNSEAAESQILSDTPMTTTPAADWSGLYGTISGTNSDMTTLYWRCIKTDCSAATTSVPFEYDIVVTFSRSSNQFAQLYQQARSFNYLVTNCVLQNFFFSYENTITSDITQMNFLYAVPLLPDTMTLYKSFEIVQVPGCNFNIQVDLTVDGSASNLDGIYGITMYVPYLTDYASAPDWYEQITQTYDATTWQNFFQLKVLTNNLYLGSGPAQSPVAFVKTYQFQYDVTVSDSASSQSMTQSFTHNPEFSGNPCKMTSIISTQTIEPLVTSILVPKSVTSDFVAFPDQVSLIKEQEYSSYVEDYTVIYNPVTGTKYCGERQYSLSLPEKIRDYIEMDVSSTNEEYTLTILPVTAEEFIGNYTMSLTVTLKEYQNWEYPGVVAGYKTIQISITGDEEEEEEEVVVEEVVVIDSGYNYTGEVQTVCSVQMFQYPTQLPQVVVYYLHSGNLVIPAPAYILNPCQNEYKPNRFLLIKPKSDSLQQISSMEYPWIKVNQATGDLHIQSDNNDLAGQNFEFEYITFLDDPNSLNATMFFDILIMQPSLQKAIDDNQAPLFIYTPIQDRSFCNKTNLTNEQVRICSQDLYIIQMECGDKYILPPIYDKEKQQCSVQSQNELFWIFQESAGNFSLNADYELQSGIYETRLMVIDPFLAQTRYNLQIKYLDCEGNPYNIAEIIKAQTTIYDKFAPPEKVMINVTDEQTLVFKFDQPIIIGQNKYNLSESSYEAEGYFPDPNQLKEGLQSLRRNLQTLDLDLILLPNHTFIHLTDLRTNETVDWKVIFMNTTQLVLKLEYQDALSIRIDSPLKIEITNLEFFFWQDNGKPVFEATGDIPGEQSDLIMLKIPKQYLSDYEYQVLEVVMTMSKKVLIYEILLMFILCWGTHKHWLSYVLSVQILVLQMVQLMTVGQNKSVRYQGTMIERPVPNLLSTYWDDINSFMRAEAFKSWLVDQLQNQTIASNSTSEVNEGNVGLNYAMLFINFSYFDIWCYIVMVLSLVCIIVRVIPPCHIAIGLFVNYLSIKLATFVFIPLLYLAIIKVEFALLPSFLYFEQNETENYLTLVHALLVLLAFALYGILFYYLYVQQKPENKFESQKKRFVRRNLVFKEMVSFDNQMWWIYEHLYKLFFVLMLAYNHFSSKDSQDEFLELAESSTTVVTQTSKLALAFATISLIYEVHKRQPFIEPKLNKVYMFELFCFTLVIYLMLAIDVMGRGMNSFEVGRNYVSWIVLCIVFGGMIILPACFILIITPHSLIHFLKFHYLSLKIRHDQFKAELDFKAQKKREKASRYFKQNLNFHDDGDGQLKLKIPSLPLAKKQLENTLDQELPYPKDYFQEIENVPKQNHGLDAFMGVPHVEEFNGSNVERVQEVIGSKIRMMVQAQIAKDHLMFGQQMKTKKSKEVEDEDLEKAEVKEQNKEESKEKVKEEDKNEQPAKKRFSVRMENFDFDEESNKMQSLNQDFKQRTSKKKKATDDIQLLVNEKVPDIGKAKEYNEAPIEYKFNNTLLAKVKQSSKKNSGMIKPQPSNTLLGQQLSQADDKDIKRGEDLENPISIIDASQLELASQFGLQLKKVEETDGETRKIDYNKITKW